MSSVEELDELEELEQTLDYFGMLELLTNHYGDGFIYVPDGVSSDHLDLAKSHGFVNEENYLTRKGRELVSQHRQR